ncbi:MAG: SGNH/GDSL hydrolase family protein [Alphaproteobacteria bacterium]|nr:SGNH/GDSL hydrolase family protein [Alphaproteobacteria bacterium]
MPDELMQLDDKLPHLAERLHAGQPVRIVAIGGASTTGSAAGSSDLAYPHRLQEILARQYPGSSITVINRGVPRQTARQMVDRFPTDVLPEDPVLVIWETGTTDAVRGVDVDDFAATLQTGIDELRAHGIDIMLIDMQFSHSTATVIDFERYLNTLHRVGDVNDLNVFPRFEMMRYWSEQNVFNFDGVAKDERAGLAAKVYECIAGKLAETIRLALQ